MPRFAHVTMRVICVLLMWNKPIARKHLQHFLAATGKDMSFDMSLLLREDVGVRAVVAKHLRQAIESRESRGSIAVPQVMFKSNHWRYATGSLVFYWQRHGDTIGLSCRDQYHFQHSTPRVSKPVHTLANYLVNEGQAANFAMVAETRLSLKEAASEPTRPIRYQRLYL